MTSLTTTFLIKEQELFNYYKYDLSEREIWIKGKAKIFLIIALLSILAIIIAPVCQLLGMSVTITSIVMLLGIISAYIFTRISDYYAVNYANIHYVQYSPLLKQSFIKRVDKKTFLRAYRADKISKKLNEPNLDNLNIEELIIYYDNASEAISSKRWWPVTLTAVVAFPVWSEFVGVMINNGTKVEEKLAISLAFLLISLSITFLISSVKTMLETILLSFPSELKELSAFVKLVVADSLNLHRLRRCYNFGRFHSNPFRIQPYFFI